MATERFNMDQFEIVLQEFEQAQGCGWVNAGLIGGELRYQIMVQQAKPGLPILIQVNSSIDASGLAQDTAENSIRVWVTDSAGAPLASKLQAYVTRVKGWEQRLTEQLEKALDMALAIQYCPKCKSLEHIYKVLKDGPNQGRMFIKCNCEGSFAWLDNPDYEPKVAAPALAPKASVVMVNWPKCPKCGKDMALRSGSKGQFWSCTGYPACRSTFDYNKAEVDRKGWGKPVQTVVDNNPVSIQKAFEAAKIAAAQPAAPTAVFKASPYQTKVFDWLKTAVENRKQGIKKVQALVVEARAGSGKTTTGVKMMGFVPPSYDAVYVAFNAPIAAELRKRLPSYIKGKTYNAMGMGICCRAYGGDELIVDDDKVYNLLNVMLDRNIYGSVFPVMKQLVGLVKANLSGTSQEELMELVEYHGIELNGNADVVFAAVQKVIAYELAEERPTVIDFNDQCWLPVVKNLPAHKHDLLCADEGQDTNKCQIALILKCIKADGIVVVVGDRNQSLYGFRGADVNAIPNIIAALNASTLPLSITYRNPTSVVSMVNERFPEIEFMAAEWAKEGTVRDVSYERALYEYKPGDMVLCRCNAPLVKPAFALIRKGIKAVIRGRDISSGLLALVKKMDAYDIVDLIRKLNAYKELEVGKLEAANKGMQAQAVADKVETVVALGDGLTTITALMDRIENIFTDESEGVVFSSVHRAKGLEAERVFILKRELMPHPMAKRDWEKVQERNIEYVALTRTLNELIFVKGE